MMSKSKALATYCPHCRRPVKKRLSFCLECGEFIDRYLELDAAPAGLTSFSPAGRVSRASSSDYMKLALLIAVLALVSIFGVTAYDAIKDITCVAGDTAVRKARAYLSKGEDENAINILSRALEEDKSGRHKESILGLLDQSLYERGLKLVQAGQYRDAVTCFSRISKDYVGREEVNKLIADNSDKALPREFSQVMLQTAEAGSRDRREELTRMDKAVMTVVPSTAHLECAGKPVVETSGGRPSVKLLAPVENGVDVSRLQQMARYNELLAGFFKRRTGPSAQVAQTSAEPPTYEEWVQGGSKEF